MDTVILKGLPRRPGSHPRGAALRSSARVIGPRNRDMVAAEASLATQDVALGAQTVVFRDDTGHLVQRVLATGATLATLDDPGTLRFADDRVAMLYREEAERAYVVHVFLAEHREVRSDPLPADARVAGESVWPDGDGVFMNWQWETPWRNGGIASPRLTADQYHEDCGSLRVARDGHVTEGRYLPLPPSPTTPHPIALPTLNATPPSGAWPASYTLIEPGVAPIEAHFPARPELGFGCIDQVVVRGQRVLVVRYFFLGHTQYTHPRMITVLDRATGAAVWSASRPPRIDEPRYP